VAASSSCAIATIADSSTVPARALARFADDSSCERAWSTNGVRKVGKITEIISAHIELASALA
jgi:hypothetical protein